MGKPQPPAGEVYGSLLLLAAQQAVRLAQDASRLDGEPGPWAIEKVAEGLAAPAAEGVPALWYREIALTVRNARPDWCEARHCGAWAAVQRAAEERGAEATATERKVKVG